MQGQRSFFDPFPETVDLSQGSVLNNTVMDQSTAWNNMLNPVEGRLSNYAQSSGEANFSCVNASGHSARSFGGWDIGESSSGVNSQDQQSNDGMKMEHGYFHSVSDTRLERQFDPSNSFLHENFGSGPDGNQIARGPFSLQSSGSSHIPMNVNLNTGYGGNTDDGGPGMGAAAFTNLYKSGRSDTEASSSSSNSGYLIENDGGSSSSLGSWGLSCKRKSLEGTSAQSFPAGSSSCFPQADNTVRHTVPLRYNASSSLSILNTPSVSRSEHLNPRIGVGIRGVPSDVFPPSVTGIAESSQRHFSVRGGPMPQETVPFNLSSSGGSVRRSSRQISLNDFLDSRPDSRPIANSTNPSNQPHLMHVPSLSRNMVPFPWGGSINSRPGTSSSSVVLPGERGAEASFRNPQRTNMDPHPNFVPATETRNMVQDPTNWSLATGSTSPNGGVPSSSRNGMGPTSGSHPFPTIWIPHHNNVTQSQQRGSDFSPWTLFPSVEADAGGQRSHFTPFPSGSSSSSSQEDAAISSGVNSLAPHQTFPRSALLMEVPSDDWRALAADMEGRQRLVSEIRQVLNAMRRRENLREDYMLLDPFINGVAELQDRHRDMRLDVDNMSYEELLALEERIGDVNTGLSEETILKTMKQRKHISFMLLSPPNLEPCCVCQEEYVSGDDIGTLDCGHDFHTDCIKQWLTQKNLCPICKMTGLGP